MNDYCRSFFNVAFIQEGYDQVAFRAEEEYAASLRKQDLIAEHRASLTRKDESAQHLDDLIQKVSTVFEKKARAREAANIALRDATDECDTLEEGLRRAGESATLNAKLEAAQTRLTAAKAEAERLQVDTPYSPHDIRVIQSVILRSSNTLGYFDESGGACPRAFAELWAKWSPVCESATKDLEAESHLFKEAIKDLVTAIRNENELRRRLGESAAFPGHACYRATIDTEELCRVLTEKRNVVKDTISRFNKRTPSTQELRTFLEDCQSLFAATDEILGCEYIAGAIGIAEGTRYSHGESDAFRLSISIQDVFATGMNLAVLGEAGAGKTTALQMYASSLYAAGVSECMCFFVPLARMVGAWQSVRTDVATRVNELECAIVAFVQSLGGHFTTSAFSEVCRQRKTVVLLDGVDEAISAAFWVIEEMSAFSRRYPTVQVITSSRMMGDYLDAIPFLGVTLRDFTDAQQEQFFRLWFGGDGEREVAGRIIEHLQRNNEMKDVVRNPLLATVMCEVAAEGGALPQSELRLFEDRVELLTGRFDQYKEVRRVKSRREDILHVARKVAYWLQENERRDEDRQVLYAVAEERASSRLSGSRARSVVDELVDPCELLVPMTADGRLGFGHRRYQEHLAAYELARQQWAKIIGLLGVSWWRSVFEFYSRMEEGIDDFIAFVARVGIKRTYRRTLKRMILVRPPSEHERLWEIVRRKGGSVIHPEAIESLVRLSRSFNQELLEEREFFEGEFDPPFADDEESPWYSE